MAGSRRVRLEEVPEMEVITEEDAVAFYDGWMEDVDLSARSWGRRAGAAGAGVAGAGVGRSTQPEAARRVVQGLEPYTFDDETTGASEKKIAGIKEEDMPEEAGEGGGVETEGDEAVGEVEVGEVERAVEAVVEPAVRPWPRTQSTYESFKSRELVEEILTSRVRVRDDPGIAWRDGSGPGRRASC